MNILSTFVQAVDRSPNFLQTMQAMRAELLEEQARRCEIDESNLLRSSPWLARHQKLVQGWSRRGARGSRRRIWERYGKVRRNWSGTDWHPTKWCRYRRGEVRARA